MAKPSKSLLATLKAQAASLRALQPEDRDAVARSGAALEEAMTALPGEPAALGELLVLCLEGLRALYFGAADDPSAVAAGVAGAVAALHSALRAGPPDDLTALFAAGQGLTAALGRDPATFIYAATGESLSAAAPAALATLDDAASLLVQTDAEDAAAVGQLQTALQQMAADGSLASATRTLVSEAAGTLERETLEARGDTAAALTDVGRLLEEAMRLSDEPPATAAPAATTAPASREPVTRPSGVVPAAPAAHSLDGPPAGAPALVLLPSDADADLLGEFITESREYVAGAEAALLALETDPEDQEAINTVFRAFHTVKGTSAFLGLSAISEMAHRAESLLSRARDHEIRCTGGYADLALRSVDMLKELIQVVHDGLGGEAVALPGGYHDLVQILSDPEAHGVSGEVSDLPEAAPRLGDILVAEGKADREIVEAAAADAGSQPIGVALVQSNAASLSDVVKALRTQKRITTPADAGADSSVRVRTDRLDRLIDMVGELVIAQSMVAQDETVLSGAHYALASKVTHTGKIVRELQDLSLSMRMVPLKATFQKMNRLVRDLAHKIGKSVEFVTEGEDTEIDRNMVDVLNDPLVHMVRNAVDHGLETPEQRVAAGKPASGTVRIVAYHAGGSVVVELQDDGKGLDREGILKKAIAKGLIDSDRAEKGMSDSEVFNLVFAPGFSTAEQVTDVSGRGVGMDVVKRSVEALHGRIDIASEKGRGATFSIRLPLTLAITDGMVVKVGGERYIIPTNNIALTFRPDQRALSTVTGRGELVNLRGELLPIFRLHRLFGLQNAAEDPTNALLVVVGDGSDGSNGTRRCALLVDELLGQQQVVAKALGEYIGKIQGVSGAAILGDGRVGLILDATEVARLAREHGMVPVAPSTLERVRAAVA